MDLGHDNEVSRSQKFFNSGFLVGPYCPIYGVGALLIIMLFSGIDNIFLLFFVSAIATCLVEFITSWIMEKMFHMRWWDYSKEFMNINGRVCLMGGLVFGALGVVLIKVRLTKFNAKLKYASEMLSEFKNKDFTAKMKDEIKEKITSYQSDLAKRLTAHERRILRDFPKLRSTRYDMILQKIKKQIPNKSKRK